MNALKYLLITCSLSLLSFLTIALAESPQVVVPRGVVPSSVEITQNGTEQLPNYVPTKITGGALTSVGSDSMDDLVKLWVEQYKKYQPEINVLVVGLGSATAPTALIEGKADLGPMARPMKTFEREEFISKYGFEPTQIRTGLAAVGVYASEKNPRNEISMIELKQIFGEPENDGLRGKGLKWSSFLLGNKNQSFGRLPVIALGRPSGSYLNAYFRQRVLLPADYAPWVLSTASAKSMFEALTMNVGTIALGEIWPTPKGIKLLEVSKTLNSGDRGKGKFAPELKEMIAGNYPLSRFLNIYIVRDPGEPLEPALTDFLRFVLSKEGQQLVEKEGMIPLPAKIAREELAKLQ